MEALEAAAPRVMVSAPVAAGDGLDVGDGCRIGAGGEGEGVAAGAEIDRAVGETALPA